ncbi:MAG: methylmalonyl-CoA mutase, partial [Paraburkholderia sp.]|nr:methylmalonyl-CoA mutase [Paraburkholderia sp.]
DGQVKRVLNALTQAARDGTDNLLALTVECMRARATVGECTRALEQIWPRYEAQLTAGAGIYGTQRGDDDAWHTACAEVMQFRKEIGRKPRTLIAKLGQDGHDRGAKVVAAALTDAGFHVSLGKLFATPEEAVEQAIKDQVDVIGVSSLCAAHLVLVSQLLACLRARNARISVVVGGIVSDEDAATLKALGAVDVFGPGTPLHSVVSAMVVAGRKAVCSGGVAVSHA